MKNKIAVITGASSGIGQAVGLNFVKRGAKVYNLDIKDAGANADNAIIDLKCDVTDEESVKNAFLHISKEDEKVDILVNNCGLQFLSPLEDFPKEKWDLLINVMLTGTFLCSREVFAGMKQRGFGRIINISSVHGKLASPFKAAYVSAKHGVLGLTKVIATEGAEHGVTCNAICPGFVDTPLMRNQVQKQMELNNLSEEAVLRDVFLKAQNIKQLTSPDQVADFAAFLASDAASTITGEAFNQSGGWAMGL